MADTTIIREFLVALGFKVDEKGLKNFKSGVEDATKGVVRLVAAIQGAALAVGAGVSAFASKLEALYFVGQRTGATTTSLKALEYAARNLGVSSQAAFGTVENLARFLRNNPAGEGYLQAIGVQTRKTNGDLRDTVDILADVGAELSKKDTWLASQYGGVLGIDENLLLAMRNGDFAKFMQQYREMSRGSGLDKAANDAHAFMIALRDLWTTFENFAIRVEGVLLKKIGPQLERFQKWFAEHEPEIADRIGDIAVALLAAAAAMGPPLSWLVDKFIELDRATDGWSTKIGLALGLFTAFGGASLIGGIWKMVAALRAMSLATAAVGTAATAAGAATAGANVAGAAGAGAAAGVGAGTGAGAAAGWLSRLLPWLSRAAGAAGLLLYSGGLNNGEEAELARRRAGSGKVGGPATASAEDPPRNAVDAVSFFQRMGWTKEQAAGIVANLRAESNLNHRAVGDNGQAIGVAQWHPDRQSNFKAWAGKDIRESSLMEQLQFVNYELTQGAERRAGALLRAARNAQQAGEIVSRYYERPALADAEASRRGAGAVQIAQDIKIDVHGVSDPVAAANEVSRQQQSVNSDMTRNMQGVIS